MKSTPSEAGSAWTPRSAKPLLSREVGDEVTLQRPRGETTYEIVDVRNAAAKQELR